MSLVMAAADVCVYPRLRCPETRALLIPDYWHGSCFD